MRTSGLHGGFTLIEVLIVVAIVAILAAAVIPKFSSSTEDAMDSALEFNLHVLRSQIQAYQAQHLGVYPTIENSDLPKLTSATNAEGEIGTPGPDYPFGPYVDEALPPNPFDGSNQVTPVAVPGQRPTRAAGNLGGWQYDATNGAIWPNHAEYYGNPTGTATPEEPVAP